MLLRMTINARRKSRGYYADEIEAPNACDRPAENHLSSTCGSVVGLSFIGNQIGEQVGKPPQIKKFLTLRVSLIIVQLIDSEGG